MSEHTIEIFVVMNEEGDAVVNNLDLEDVMESARDSIGGEVFRVVRLEVTMSTPTVAAVSVRVPDVAGQPAAVRVAP